MISQQVRVAGRRSRLGRYLATAVAGDFGAFADWLGKAPCLDVLQMLAATALDADAVIKSCTFSRQSSLTRAWSRVIDLAVCKERQQGGRNT